MGAIAGLHAIRPSAEVVVLTATTSDRVLVAAMEPAPRIARTQRLDDVIAVCVPPPGASPRSAPDC